MQSRQGFAQAAPSTAHEQTAQRPDATVCASMDVWNNRMHRWINKGSKGIALLRENGNGYGLEYVFDVADTNDRYNREVKLWQYDERYDNAIKEWSARNWNTYAIFICHDRL